MKISWILWKHLFGHVWYLNRSFKVKRCKTAECEQSGILTSHNVKSIEMLLFQWQLIKIQLHHSVIDLIMLKARKKRWKSIWKLEYKHKEGWSENARPFERNFPANNWWIFETAFPFAVRRRANSETANDIGKMPESIKWFQYFFISLFLPWE